MSNVYGSEEYNCYRKEYLSSCEFEKTGEENITLNQLEATIESFECNYNISGFCGYKEKTITTIIDLYHKKHIYECIDEFFPPYEFSYNGSEYLIFRKSLYGYTILDLNHFTEVNYFPSDVINGKEAFIICEVKILKDLLILGGGFWACPYECYVLSLETFEIADISELFHIADIADNGINVLNEVLVLTEANSNKIFSFQYEELLKCIELGHRKDL